MARVRVGILMEGTRCPSPLRGMIEALHDDGNIELFLIRSDAVPGSCFARLARSVRHQGIRAPLSALPFAAVARIERWIIRTAAAARFRSRLEEKPVDETLFRAVVAANPVSSGDARRLCYGDDDLARIGALDLDLLVRGTARGRLEGGIPGAAARGILSVDYCEQDEGRRCAPGFREVHARAPSTGFAIVRLTDEAGDAEIVLRSGIATQRSFTENRLMLDEIAAGFLAQTIRHVAATGALPHAGREPEAPPPPRRLDVPGPTATLAYVCKTVALYAALAARRLVLGKKQRWSVAFARTPWQALSFARATIVRNPPGRFLADPFVVTRDGRSVVFAEDFSYARGRGTISAIVLDGDDYTIVPDVVAEPFHLSFPFLFEFDGDLYMAPESHEANAIRVYRCVAFPDVWEYRHDLMTGVRAADSMIVPQSGRWWLLTNIAPPGCRAFDAQLCAFSADSPLSRTWTPHPDNPVVLSPAVSRNGGMVRDDDGAILRVRQRPGFAQYGESVSLARIVRLDPTGYAEKSERDIRPDFLPGLKGTHHLHSDGTVTVFDVVREERVG